jgi:hypothetical protein
MNAGRSTAPINTTGVPSARYRPTTTTTTNNPPITTNIPPIATKTTPNIQPKVNIPTAQVSRTFDQPTECKQELCI